MSADFMNPVKVTVESSTFRENKAESSGAVFDNSFDLII